MKRVIIPLVVSTVALAVAVYDEPLIVPSSISDGAISWESVPPDANYVNIQWALEPDGPWYDTWDHFTYMDVASTSSVALPTSYRVLAVVDSNSYKEIDLISYLNPFGVCVYNSFKEGSGPVSEWVTRMLGTTTKNGLPIILKQEYDENGYLNDQQFISTDFSTSCSQIGGHNFGEGDWYWNRPLPFLLNRFVPGQAYSFTGFERDFGYVDLTLQMYLEKVSVPAGIYDSIKVVSTFEILSPSPASGTDVFIAWYAKNIGMVKRLQEDGTIWELKRYDNYTP